MFVSLLVRVRVCAPNPMAGCLTESTARYLFQFCQSAIGGAHHNRVDILNFHFIDAAAYVDVSPSMLGCWSCRHEGEKNIEH